MGGMVLGGNYIVSNPEVVSGGGELGIPRPVLVKASKLPERVTQSGRATVAEINWHSDMVAVTSVRDRRSVYYPGFPLIDVRLVVGLGDGDVFDLEPGDTVRLFVVKKAGG